MGLADKTGGLQKRSGIADSELGETDIRAWRPRARGAQERKPGECPSVARLTIATAVAVLWIVGAAPALCTGQEAPDGQEEEGIRDNSFLIEEAFNQEPGIVQHIFNWVPSWQWNGGRQNDFDFLFTQEWPLGSQRHQFSYTLPMRYTSQQAPGEPAFEGQGFDDMLLNYRYQALQGEFRGWYAAPRVSVILPTGNVRDRLGNDRVGYQVCFPFSKEFKRWAVHLNAGATYIPGVTVGIDPVLAPVVGHDLRTYNLGASAIYFLRPNLHLMCETVAVWDEELQPNGGRDHTFRHLLSPGVRWSPYTERDTQWVLGVGVPIGLTRDSPDVSLFLYMSFEHRFHKKRVAKEAGALRRGVTPGPSPRAARTRGRKKAQQKGTGVVVPRTSRRENDSPSPFPLHLSSFPFPRVRPIAPAAQV